MISEPELVGGDGEGPIPPSHGSPPGPVPVPAPAGEPGTMEQLPDGERRARRPWLWALGGALVASALWAGGLYAYRAMGPDLGGYRATEDLCGEAQLTALSLAYGKRNGGPAEGPHSKHEALDRAECSVTFGTGEPSYGADFTYVLHKKTDPGPEFEPLEISDIYSDYDWQPVAGLGERAFYSEDAEGFAALKVLDGQAVLTLFVTVQMDYDPDSGEAPPEPDSSALSGVKDLMVEDMRSLMAELKS
ncbi:hypothetical protein AB0J57_10715 [Streptomyces sp. NPDC049837]|uniref:hypothetical protein n=1 Tax=Streptomyces sp. NPDC049837 TaxID=3155277 RepID=UPI00343D34D7